MSTPLSTHPKGAQFRFGVVAEVDAARARVKVRLPEQADLLTTWIPVASPLAHQDRVLALPRVGAQVALLTDAQCEDGVCLGSIYSNPDPVPADTDGQQFGVWYEDGTVVRYDQALGELLADLSTPQGTARVTSKQIAAEASADLDATAAEGMTLQSRQMSASAGEGMTLSAGQGMGLSAGAIDLTGTERIGLAAPALAVSGSGASFSVQDGVVTIQGAQVIITGDDRVEILAGAEVTITAPVIRLVGITTIEGDIDI